MRFGGAPLIGSDYHFFGEECEAVQNETQKQTKGIWTWIVRFSEVRLQAAFEQKLCDKYTLQYAHAFVVSRDLKKGIWVHNCGIIVNNYK